MSFPHLNTSFDEQYDSFLDLDNFTSPDVKPVPILTPQSSIPGSAIFSSSTPNFPQPSFNYESYKQQTGFVHGALAETSRLSRNTGLQYYQQGNGGMVMPLETLNMPLSDLDDFDFSNNPVEMDFDVSSDTPNFVSPNALVVGNNTSSPVKRIYPGMHSQQAARAKAQKQEQEQARKQSQALQDQKPLLSPSAAKSAKDPVVEASISRLLSKMRADSTVSAPEDKESPAGMSGMPRIKKDEEDMDEDELLLASEEGKKLSSKERRQLRNKVSARAFRSRRKEYIGQLEGEIAAKSQEANDLRVQNQQLREENNRLTDLTRMLLSSPAFSGFLQELSQSGVPPPNTQKQFEQQKPVQAQPQPRMMKDVSSSTANQQLQNQQPQIGMALIPETPVDFSVLQPSNGWMNTLLTNDFHVYAVTELPPSPVLDLESLSGKPVSSTGSSKGLKELPRLPELLAHDTKSTDAEAAQTDVSVTLDQDAFALYFNSAACEKGESLVQVDLNTTSSASDISEEDEMVALKKLCADLEVSCDELSKYILHME